LQRQLSCTYNVHLGTRMFRAIATANASANRLVSHACGAVSYGALSDMQEKQVIKPSRASVRRNNIECSTNDQYCILHCKLVQV